MADSRYIKITAFGGYDTAAVDKRLEELYNMVYNLKNELREAKLVIKKYEEGADQEKAYENALAVERAQLTQLQVKNENLSRKNKAIREENVLKEQENTKLRIQNDELSKKLDDAELKINSLSGNTMESIGIVFVEAQKSRELIINLAKQEAEACEAASRNFAESFIADTNNKALKIVYEAESRAAEMIADANNEASKIIYEAEKRAAEIIAEAKNNSERMSVAENNFKAVMLSDIGRIGAKLDKLSSYFDEFEKEGLGLLVKSQEILDSAGIQQKNDGTSVFRVPEKFAPEYPKEPEYRQTYKEKSKHAPKKNEALDRLQAMAEAIEGSKSKPVPDKTEKNSSADTAEKSQNTQKKGGINLSDLLKQANELTK